MKCWVLFLLLLSCSLCAFETMIESDEVHYNGELITLCGNVAVENAMGRVTASTATLKKDELKTTKVEFPWIELNHTVCLTLADGGVLCCETLFLDYTQMTGSLHGNPQVTFSSPLGEVYADKAIIDFQEVEGSLEATKVTLMQNVRLVNKGSEEKPVNQYALADEVYYFPKEQRAILEGKNAKVLFYDPVRDMQLSARTVRAQRDPITKKESFQGVGDVRFLFGPEELEKIKQRFPDR